MASGKLERQLEQLAALRLAGSSDAALVELRKAIAARPNVLVARAAVIAGDWQARQLLPDLLAAFDRFFVKATESDPQCWAKNAIAKALKDFEFTESAAFLRGIEHHQWEAVWGGKSDTAAALRSTCALALVHCRDISRDSFLCHLVKALTDSDVGVRVDATRALEQMGGREVALLLRLKARLGDKEMRVTGQVFESFLQVDGPSGVAFIAEFLQHADQEVSAEAALALSASRSPAAVEVLKQAWLRTHALQDRTTLLRAISASRLDVAFDFLVDLVQTGSLDEAEDALRALELHLHYEPIVTRLASAVAGRPELQASFHDRFHR